jgi:adenine nucleotide transporter 17
MVRHVTRVCAVAQAGTVGGLAALAIFYPLDVLRSLVQLDDARVKGLPTVTALERLWREGEVLYQGLAASAATQGISSFIYFYVYNAFKRYTTVAANIPRIGVKVGDQRDA